MTEKEKRGISEESRRIVLERAILEVMNENHPENVSQLVELVYEKIEYPEKMIVDQVLKLQESGRLVLKAPLISFTSFGNYLSSDRSLWFWTIILVTFSSVSAAVLIPENSFPLVLIRYILGSILVMFLSGYSFLRAFQPKAELNYLEELLFSIGISIFFVFIIGLFLNFTPWGITTVPILLCLSSITISAATVAILKEYQKTRKLK